jgi:hypothetical protein
MPYIICSEDDNSVANLETLLWGRRSVLLAMFIHEADALEVLYQMEQPGVAGHKIMHTESSFVAASAPHISEGR